MKKRMIRVGILAVGAAVLAVGYLLLWQLTGISFFCPIKKLFHIDCPGCGITRALASLLVLDIKGMLRANLFSPIIVGYIGYTAIAAAVSYIRSGRVHVTYRPAWANLLLLVLLLAYGILRNLFPII